MTMPAETGSPSTPPAPMRRIVRPRTTLFGALRMPTPLRRKSVILPLPTMRTPAWPSFAMPSPPAAFVPEIVWPPRLTVMPSAPMTSAVPGQRRRSAVSVVLFVSVAPQLKRRRAGARAARAEAETAARGEREQVRASNAHDRSLL